MEIIDRRFCVITLLSLVVMLSSLFSETQFIHLKTEAGLGGDEPSFFLKQKRRDEIKQLYVQNKYITFFL